MSSIVERSLTAVRTIFRRLGDWVAGFTFWRFVLFSLLVLIAAVAIGSLLPKIPKPKTVVATASVGIKTLPHAEKPATSEAPPAETPAAKPTDATGTSAKSKERCLNEMNIDWTGVHMKNDCRGASTEAPDAEATANADQEISASDIADAEGDAPSPNEDTVGLADVALAVLAVLWIVWFVSRSRMKAEARADVAEAVAAKEGLERQVAEARLQALQAQVEPHFLFNTLGAVEHLIETDPPRAATMQRHLIAFLRGAMPRMRGEAVTLVDEVELCRNYLAIMKIRMEDRLDYNIDLPADLAGASFPPMMLQSVVENALKHGLEPKAEGGSIWISARAAAGRLRVSVADSGLGFGGADTAGTGIGLNNIRERLTGLFSNQGALVISPNAPTGAQVTIEIPHGSNGNHRG